MKIIEKYCPKTLIKTLTEYYFHKKHIKEWKLINNGILEYGNFLFEEFKKRCK